MPKSKNSSVSRRLGDWVGGRAGLRENRVFRVRILVQLLFTLLSVVMGLQLARFYWAAREAEMPLPARPPGVEGYLPISGLMGVMDWIYQGTLNHIHPAATILVIVALAMAFLLRKAFCSWVCPVGFLSDVLARFGRWSFRRNIRIWKWADIPLRSIKYLFLAFFLGAIVSMGRGGLQAFIQSPYNRVAEVKMGLFFLDLGRTGTLVIGVLVLASVFVKGAWCRYLCPYGALLGFFSWLSPARVVRDANACVGCGLCDRACGAGLAISRKGQILTPECTGCLDCIAACPVQDALGLVGPRRRRIPHLAVAAAVVGFFAVAYVGARVTGSWRNGISDREYVERLQEMESPAYGHPGR